ncbi:hypothetical protein [Streptomyces sp. NPDC002573]|uniref:hypothetical protein n=1 Tax=Streptomyces sp. NPDC002573 TaxID=3364651 RepID=UPI0036992E1E
MTLLRNEWPTGEHLNEFPADLAAAWAACVASGLRRLPSYRGAAQYTMSISSVEAARYVPGQVVLQPEVIRAVPAPAPAAGTDTVFLVWSVGGRRTDALRTGKATILIPGNSEFKVLAAENLADDSGKKRLWVLLRELTAAEQCSEAEIDRTSKLGELDEEDMAIRSRLLKIADGGSGTSQSEARAGSNLNP